MCAGLRKVRQLRPFRAFSGPLFADGAELGFQIAEADDQAAQAKLPIYTLLHVVGSTTTTTTATTAPTTTSTTTSAMHPDALAVHVKCGCLTCEREALKNAASAASKRDAEQLSDTPVIEAASYMYLNIDPCHAVIPGMPVGGWKPGEVAPHMRITRYGSRNVVKVYSLCVRVRVRVHGSSTSKRSTADADKAGEAGEADDDYETECKGAFEYYKTNAWDDFVTKNPKWSDIGHCYFLIIGGKYVPYNQWVKQYTPLHTVLEEEEREEEEEQVPARIVPACEPEQAAHNHSLQENLRVSSGVYDDIKIDPDHASLCSEYILKNWTKGMLALGDHTARGYNSFNLTEKAFNQDQQKLRTLVITSELLEPARKFLHLFAEIESSVLRQLARRVNKTQSQLKVQHCHLLSQSIKTGGSSVFGWHRDDEVESESDDSGVPVYTVIVKLTADKAGSAPSQMMIADAAFPFSYGAPAGSSGWFLSNLWHRSVMPVSEDTRIKLALFISDQS